MNNTLYEPYLTGAIKPVFGDESMINIQRAYQAEMEKRESKEKEVGKPLNKYVVTFEVWDSVDIEVEAIDEREAVEIAEEEFDIHDLDLTTRAKLIPETKLKRVL